MQCYSKLLSLETGVFVDFKTAYIEGPSSKSLFPRRQEIKGLSFSLVCITICQVSFCVQCFIKFDDFLLSLMINHTNQ